MESVETVNCSTPGAIQYSELDTCKHTQFQQRHQTFLLCSPSFKNHTFMSEHSILQATGDAFVTTFVSYTSHNTIITLRPFVTVFVSYMSHNTLVILRPFVTTFVSYTPHKT